MKNFSDGFYIGIDSGGTKCELLITDTGRKTLFSDSYKGVHFSLTGSKEYAEIITRFILHSLKTVKLNIKNCHGIGIGAAGAREDKDRSELTKYFRRILKYENIVITTDAMTALYGAFEGKEGIILISGTGSVLYGYVNGKITRVGGWGRIIGDEGSGYWIGKRALNLVMKEYDRKVKARSILSKELEKKFGISNKNINEKIFQRGFEIQKIAPVVIQSAEKNCSLGKQIVNEAVEGLTEHIHTFIGITRRKKETGIAFIGSIIENKNILSDKLRSEIKKLKIIKVTVKKYSPAYGAVLIAGEKNILANRKIN